MSSTRPDGIAEETTTRLDARLLPAGLYNPELLEPPVLPAGEEPERMAGAAVWESRTGVEGAPDIMSVG